MSNFMEMLSHHNQNNSQYKNIRVVTAISNDYVYNHPLPSCIVYNYRLRVRLLP